MFAELEDAKPATAALLSGAFHSSQLASAKFTTPCVCPYIAVW
jgi:hypothetical protein